MGGITSAVLCPSRPATSSSSVTDGAADGGRERDAYSGGPVQLPFYHRRVSLSVLLSYAIIRGVCRYRYYGRLAAAANAPYMRGQAQQPVLDIGLAPSHILPSHLFLVRAVRVATAMRIACVAVEQVPFLHRGDTQGRATTVFSLWATTVGISVFSIPWGAARRPDGCSRQSSSGTARTGLSESGFVLGLAMMALFSTISCYTALLVLRNGTGFVDMVDLCSDVLGVCASERVGQPPIARVQVSVADFLRFGRPYRCLSAWPLRSTSSWRRASSKLVRRCCHVVLSVVSFDGNVLQRALARPMASTTLG